MGAGRYLTAGEAAAELGVSLPTLYSYVSRGMVRSEAAEGGRRSRRYRAEDVRALKERKERRRDPEAVAEGALRWGAPVLERSEEHTSELQSRQYLVCRLLLEKKKTLPLY